MPRTVYLIFILLCCCDCAQRNTSKPLEPAVQAFHYGLPDRDIRVLSFTYGQSLPPFYLIRLHDDETTAEEAGRKVLQRHGGRLLVIENGSRRNIGFSIDGKKYSIDPNRMFSARGIRASLQRSGASGEEAVTEAAKLAAFFLELLPGGVCVSVHNNTDKDYTVEDYRKGGRLETAAAMVHRNAAMDMDDFVFTTSSRVFRHFRDMNMNVVLQNNSTVEDDGSLSVYFGRCGEEYVNVEAEHGHVEAQVRMLEELYKLLK